MTELLVLPWLYIVGAGVTYCLLRGEEKQPLHWAHHAIIAGWPVSIPLIVALRVARML